MKRLPVVAGTFYPGSAGNLKRALSRLMPPQAKKRKAIGLVCPHAGYIYSGQVAGRCFSGIKGVKNYILLGPNHTGEGASYSIMTQGRWSTPLGEVGINEKLAKQILHHCPDLKSDYLAHLNEHSLEVQLPFLQYLNPEFRIVPIVLAAGSVDAYIRIGTGLAQAIKEPGEDSMIVASSDMTHYEPRAEAEKKDRAAIEMIVKLDGGGLMKRIESLNISMCGYAPVITLIAAAKRLGAKHAELLDYRTSGDASGDYASVVGYAGMVMV